MKIGTGTGAGARAGVGILPAFLFLTFISIPLTSATTVSIGDVFVEPGGNATTYLVINNVTDIGTADITLTYDPSVVHVVRVMNSDFNLLFRVINNSAGITRIGGIADDGLTGDVKLAGLMLKAVGDAGERSLLGININELKKSVPPPEISVPATVDNGTAFLNLPPVAIARSVHRYNNVGSKYLCNATFDGSASYDPSINGSITSYDWDFGDGQSREGKIVEHIYAICKWNGTNYEPFNVSLTVSDNLLLANTTIIQTDVYIAGDANGDGEVDIFDAVIVGLEWDKECTGRRWATARGDMADLNNDCVVDIFDAVIIGANWDHVAW